MSPEMLMLIGLMNYAAYSTGLPVPNELPNIEWHSRCHINDVMYGMPCEETDSADSFAAAMFEHETQTITFSTEDIDLNTLQGKAAALHELVHWVQFVAMLDGNAIIQDVLDSSHCLAGALEPAAYRAQFEWLRENHVDPWTTMPMDWATLHLATTCRPVYELSSN